MTTINWRLDRWSSFAGQKECIIYSTGRGHVQNKNTVLSQEFCFYGRGKAGIRDVYLAWLFCTIFCYVATVASFWPHRLMPLHFPINRPYGVESYLWLAYTKKMTKQQEHFCYTSWFIFCASYGRWKQWVINIWPSAAYLNRAKNRLSALPDWLSTWWTCQWTSPSMASPW